MTNLEDKDFFKHIQQEGKEYSERIEEAFPYFCLKIFWDDLSHDDIQDALRGLKTNDESIDAFFIDEELREINIIQCKSCESYKRRISIKKQDLTFLRDAPKTLYNEEYINDHRNERIKDIATEYVTYKKQGYQEKLYFFHLGREGTLHLVENNYKEITYYDWDSIKNAYLEYVSKLDRTEPESMKIQLESAVIEPRVGQKHKTLISVITGDAIILLREKHKYKLFDKNLRFGLGKTSINKKIQETTRREPDNFYFYNNGITITSKGFKHTDNNALTITYPQIINGAQTVNALYDCFQDMVKTKTRKLDGDTETARKETQEHFKKIKIIFRVITDNEKDGKKNTEFENKVINYNNSQNSVKVTDFYANEREQIDIQRIMADYGYFYEIKRGDRKYLESNPRAKHNLLQKTKSDFKFWDEKITIENLASIWMAFTEDPSLHAVAKRNIFGHAQDKYYKIIFGNTNIDDTLVRKMILAYNIMTGIEKQSAIYASRQKDGQIITKITQLNKEKFDEKTYENIKSMVSHIAFLPSLIIKDIEQKDTFLEQKENILKEIKKYQYFSLGKYLTLRIFYFIIEKCKYWDKLLLNTNLFENKEHIDAIVQAWIKTILDEIIEKEHAEFIEKIGGALSSFYVRSDTTKNIEKRFDELRYGLNKEYTHIFTLA